MTTTSLEPEETTARGVTCPVCDTPPHQPCSYPPWVGIPNQAHLERLVAAQLNLHATTPRNPRPTCLTTWGTPRHFCDLPPVTDLWHRHRCRCGEQAPQ